MSGDGSSGVILVVDDEELVRNFVTVALGLSGYDVLEAVGASEALDLLAEHVDQIDAVLLDMNMPRMSGADVFPSMKALRCDLPILLLSGHSSDVRQIMDEGAAGFLKKPFLPADLLTAVESLF